MAEVAYRWGNPHSVEAVWITFRHATLLLAFHAQVLLRVTRPRAFHNRFYVLIDASFYKMHCNTSLPYTCCKYWRLLPSLPQLAHVASSLLIERSSTCWVSRSDMTSSSSLDAAIFLCAPTTDQTLESKLMCINVSNFSITSRFYTRITDATRPPPFKRALKSNVLLVLWVYKCNHARVTLF